jgi:hypothetical protein
MAATSTPTRRTRFSRRIPDHVTDELVNVLSSPRIYEFNELFGFVYENLKKRNAVSGGEEMLRLRAYEKLQNLVGRNLVEKSGRQYRGLPGLEVASSANQPKPVLTPALSPERVAAVAREAELEVLAEERARAAAARAASRAAGATAAAAKSVAKVSKPAAPAKPVKKPAPAAAKKVEKKAPVKPKAKTPAKPAKAAKPAPKKPAQPVKKAVAKKPVAKAKPAVKPAAKAKKPAPKKK